MTCFGGRDERIYMAEMLVHKLTLTKEKTKDIGEFPVAIKIKLLDFPVFEITRQDFYSYEPPPPEDEGCSLRFMIGRSCMFVMRPMDLVRELQSRPVHVGVFRVHDTYPIAETEIMLPGCLCDQVAMSQNDPENLPKPFAVTEKYNLTDPGGNNSGTLEMELKLLCFGRSLITHYELHSKFLVFKNQDKEREFCVRRLVPASHHPEGLSKDVSQFPNRTTLDELKGIDPTAQRKKGKKGKKNKKGGKKGKK